LFGAIVAVIWYGVVLASQNQLLIGDLISFILYSAFVGASFGGIAELYAQIQKAVGATERVFELLEEIKIHPEKHIISSWRVQPNIFNNPPQKPGNIFFPVDYIGAYFDDFDETSFLEFADEFIKLNKLQNHRLERDQHLQDSIKQSNFLGCFHS
jgi:ABC-type multidrug transport system fused ATPase/permease subunit